jgi:plasmid maintenance system antidote protein VapI
MAVGPSKVFGGSVASWLTQQAHYDLAHIDADRIKLKRPPSIWTSQLALPYRSETGLVVTLG